MNGVIASNVAVNAGATLGGTGTVGGLTVRNGGTVAPGNSIGTTSVSGNYTHDAGAHYDVEIDAAGNSDRIDVTGSTTINGGDIRVTSEAGDYVNGSTYTILTSGSAISGAFDSITDDLALFDASLIYNSNDIVMVLNRASTNFIDDAGTVNQRAVASLLDSQSLTAEGDFANVLQELYGLSASGKQAAFDALSGDIHGGAAIATLATSGSFLQFLNGGSFGASSNAVVRGQSPDDCCAPVDAGMTGWIRAIGQTGTIDGTGGSGGFDYGVSGQAIGLERNVEDWLMFGGAVYSSQLHTSAANTNTHVDSDRIALYGSGQGSLLKLFGALGFGHHSYDSSRYLTVGALDRTARAGFDGQEFVTYWELSIPRSVGAFTLEPLVGLQIVSLTQDEFRETGAGAMNLRVNESTTTSVRPSFGGRALLPGFMLIRIPMTGQLHARYMYEGGDSSGNVTAGFNNGAGGTFSIQGADVGQHFGMFGVSLTAQLTDRTSLYLAYDGLVSESSSAHAGNLGLTFDW